MQVILPWSRVTHIKIGFHIGPLAKVEIQVGMGVAVAVLAVDITDVPGGVLYVASHEFLVPTLSVGTRKGRLVKRYGVYSFFGYFIMKDKGEFLKKSEK